MTRSAAEVHALIALRDEFYLLLEDEHAKRSRRGTQATGLEQHAMLEAVNRERHAAGINGVTIEDIVRIERLALGHSDYASKFALHCAELAMGMRS